MNIYRARELISKEQFTNTLEFGDEQSVTQAMMDAVDSIDDSAWLLGKLKYQLQNRNELWIVGTSIVALTELALFNSEIDPKEIYALVEPFAQIDEYRDWAEAALADLRNLSPD